MSSPETTRLRGSRGPTNSSTSTNNQSQPPEPSSDSEYDSSSSSSSSTTSSRPSSLLQPTSLYPPFYNRPPTPLPPSPSLTSLLLPNRTPSVHTLSAPPSPRHTPLHSPDHSPSASDTESIPHGARAAASATSTATSTTTNSAAPLTTDSSLAFSSHFASQTPRASPRVPTYEYYGFVLYLISTVSFLMYILWSYLPAPMLHAIGIHYYPSRWWSLALPSWLVVAVGWIYVALAGYNTGYLTPDLNAVEGVIDGVAKIATVNFEREREKGGEKEKERERDWKKLWNKGTDGVIDIPIGGVCEVLYGEGRELEEWEVYGLDSGSGYDGQYDGEGREALIRNADTGGDGLGILAGDGSGHQDEREEWVKFREQLNLPQSPSRADVHSWGRNGSVSESGGAGGEGGKGGRRSKKRGSGGGGGKQQGRR